MKNTFRPKILPWFTMGAGGLGLVLRLWYLSGMDEKGLLPATHIASVLTLLLSGLVLAVLFLCTRQLAPVSKFSRLFPAGIGRAVGCVIGAVGILRGGLYFLGSAGLGLVTFLLSVLAAASMAVLAYFRLKGIRPHMLLHTAVTLFIMLFTVCNCRIWGSEPQIQVFMFPLFACVFLMLSAYHITVTAVQKCNRQWLVFTNQAALFFCCLSLGGQARLFYLAMIFYLALDLCSLNTERPVQLTEEA